MRHERNWSIRILLGGLLCVATGVTSGAEQRPERFGGAFTSLGERRQLLVNDWVERFVKATGQQVEPGPFYDEVLSLSTKTTFDAVTHALMTTPLTDRDGASLGNALALIANVDSVRGEVAGARSDAQFRMYVRLVDDAVGVLERSQQFKRGSDNTVYHKGYPISYRAQGGVPSIQISIARDQRRADIDVDYRASSFPTALFNGHLSASNSDVRAGSNFDRHSRRWTGFENWWRGFFGVRHTRETEPVASTSPLSLPSVPRAGKAAIDVMVHDFLTAWLVEGNVVAAMGYVSPRSYACLARDRDEPSSFDRGVAPFQLLTSLKSVHDTLGPRTSLQGLVVGTRLATPALRVVEHPHHAQFVVYSVPDDIAASFDCERQLAVADDTPARRRYGTYFGATFFIDGQRDSPVALLWARERGYWKIVSWKVGADDATMPAMEPVPDPEVTRIAADPTLVKAAQGFLESWLVRKDYDAAFAYLTPASYACFDLERGPEQPPSTSPEDAARRLRAGLETSARTLGTSRKLESILTAAEPSHPAVRVVDHPQSRTFSLTSIPNALGDAVECAARQADTVAPDPLPLEYGQAYGMTVRFKTPSGDAPVLRVLWRRLDDAWRITSYGIEMP